MKRPTFLAAGPEAGTVIAGGINRRGLHEPKTGVVILVIAAVPAGAQACGPVHCFVKGDRTPSHW
jgi:hypothetical protein